ncbi:MAG: hypothetical protein ACI9OJ_001791 [Myxococcota bacterium]
MTFSYVVDRIPTAGRDVSDDATREWITFLLGKHLQPDEGPFPLRLTLSRSDRSVKVDGELELGFHFECGRCAEKGATRQTLPIRLLFAHGREPEEDDEEEVEIDVWGHEDDRELIMYEGPEVLLEDAIIEQVVLALPSYPLCQPDCKGLCPECTENLNTSSCSCSAGPVDPRWAKLKDLKV